MNEVRSEILFFLNGFSRFRWVGLAASWIACVVGWFAVAMIPDTYTSSGRIYVDTASVLQPLLRGLAVDVDGDVAKQVGLMKKTLLSRPNLMKIARAVDPSVEQPSTADLEHIIERLSRNVTVSAEPDNMFTLSYAAPDPHEAKNVVDALMTVFIETNLGANRADIDMARQFIDDQIRAYEIKLESAEKRAAKFKQENLDLLPGAGGYHGRLERARNELSAAKTELRQALTDRDTLRSELPNVPEFLEFVSDEPITGYGPPTRRDSLIMELEVKLAELLSSYTEKHPDVILTRRKLSALYEERDREFEAQLASTGEGMRGASPPPTVKYRSYNPLHAQLRARFIELDSRVAFLEQRVAQKAEELAQIESLATSVPMVEAEFTRLNRDYDVLRSKYQELLARREAAKISQEREVQRAEKNQFRVVEPPQVPNEPSGPNRTLLLLAATAGGIGAATAAVIILILMDTRISHPDRLARQFGIPVLGSVISIVGPGRRVAQIFGHCLYCLAFLSLPVSLGVLLYVDSQVGLGNVSLVELNPEYLPLKFIGGT